MILEVDQTSATPPYEQIREQVVQLVGSGALVEGVRLPSIRQLASDLGVAPGTVARAYRELEADGVVTSRVRHGTVVAPAPTAAAGSQDRVRAAARAYALAVRGLGVGRDQAIEAFDRQLRELPGR